MAIIVPIGIDFCGSAKSPERFEPAIIPAKYKERERELGREGRKAAGSLVKEEISESK